MLKFVGKLNFKNNKTTGLLLANVHLS